MIQSNQGVITPALLYTLKNKGYCFSKNISLTNFSSWKVGGRAPALVRPTSIEQIVELRKLFTQNNAPNLVIGNTTNLLFTDDYIDAILVQIGSKFSKITIKDEIIIAQAGVWVPKLARAAMQAGLTGIEHTCGIPGTLGGLVVMNGGSQRKGIGDNIIHVKTVDRNGQLKKYSNEDCFFSYRSSIFQQLDEVIVEVTLQLKKDKSKKNIHAEMLSILRERSKKFPRKYPNCGSVFVSNPAMYEQYGAPGKVIEDCKLKGMRIGDAQISPSHANFIINRGNAAARDIIKLIHFTRKKVHQEKGYLMEVEPKYVDINGSILRI